MTSLPDTHIKLLFPSLLYSNTVSISEEYRCSLIQFIRDRIAQLDNSKGNEFDVQTTYFDDDVTPYDMRIPLFEEITAKIDDHVSMYCKEAGYPSTVCPKTMLKTYWGSISKHGQCHFLHHHGNSKISGVYYLQVPTDKQLTLIFQGSANQNRYEDKFGSAADNVDGRVKHALHSDEHLEPIRTDQILIFNGGTMHGYMPNPSKTDKITIAFNYSF